MTTVEKILIPLFLVGAMTINLTGQLDLGPEWLHLTATLLTFSTLLGLCIYYLSQTKPSIYWLAFIMLALDPVGRLFTSMHWRGANSILGIGLIMTSLLVAGLLVKTGLQFFQDKKGEVIFNFIIATLLIGQLIIVFFSTFMDIIEFGQAINYVLLAAILTMKLKGIELKIQESRVLTVVALQTALFIISDTVDLLK